MTNEDECDECPETKNHTVKIFSPIIQVFSVEPFGVMAQISITLYVVPKDSWSSTMVRRFQAAAEVSIGRTRSSSALSEAEQQLFQTAIS